LSSFDLLMEREVATTRHPRSSSACVRPRPIPLEAPVTIATACWVVFILNLFEIVLFERQETLRTNLRAIYKELVFAQRNQTIPRDA
jgi:hypothetical protein